MDQLDFLLEDGEKPFGIKHRCFYFSKDVVLFVKDCKYDKVFASLFDQLVRSATSIGANLIEGKAGSSRKDWIKYTTIRLKSANEAKYWLCLIRDTLDIDNERIRALISEAIEISNIIASIIINAKKSNL